jgi:DNA-binding CsgD family transcriptional regulator
MFAVDATQRIVAWNREASRLFGQDNGNILGAHCFELVGALDRKGHRFCREDCPVIAAARDGNPPPTLRLQARARNGEVVPVDVSTIVLYSEDQVSAVIHLCRPGSDATHVHPGPVGQPRLTRREQEVLGCLCKGFSTAEIATELKISGITVRNHVQHLLDKLAVHSRSEVVALAYQDGLLR